MIPEIFEVLKESLGYELAAANECFSHMCILNATLSDGAVVSLLLDISLSLSLFPLCVDSEIFTFRTKQINLK